MGDKTGIQWTDSTWSPIAAFRRGNGKRGWACTKPSAGCKHCYAEALNKRLGTGLPFTTKALEEVDIRLVNLDQPIRWKRPRRIFVNSMTDTFGEFVSEQQWRAMYGVMAATPQHTYQVLTKRAGIRREWQAGMTGALDLSSLLHEAVKHEMGYDHPRRPAVNLLGRRWPLPNVWEGVSVESPEHYDRIEELRQTPAALRFLSIEPMLAACPNLPLDGIHWVIVGGESGRDARPCNVLWIQDVVEQCKAAGVACFVKQLGSRAMTRQAPPSTYPPRKTEFIDFGDRLDMEDPKGGNPAEWPLPLRVREFPHTEAV